MFLGRIEEGFGMGIDWVGEIAAGLSLSDFVLLSENLYCKEGC